MPRRPYPPVIGLAALAGLNWLHAQAVRWVIRRNLARLWAGDPEPLLATYADDVHFCFPGRSSWAGEFRGKEEVARWLRRFVRVGLRFEVHEILVAGPPWDATLCLWFTDRLTDAGGSVVYENRGTIMVKLAWGKIIAYEVNEDTQKVAALDDYLEGHGLSATAASEPTSTASQQQPRFDQGHEAKGRHGLVDEQKRSAPQRAERHAGGAVRGTPGSSSARGVGH